jgi:putative phage-type endonuclease
MEALKKYLSHETKREKITNMFHTVCDFLNDMENTYPVPAHSKLLEEWEEDVRQQWADTFDEEGPGRKAQQVLEAVLAFRREVHQAATFQEHTQREKQSWNWLLIAEQSEQRTEDWHKEKIDLLTASEIGALWAGPRTRARLVLSKVPNDNPPFTSRLAVLRSMGHAMDWGVRYEPIVKTLLQTQLGITITDLGRIRHRTIPNLAASPDGLITEGPDDLKGRLVEIKCPPTRIIDETVPFEYWAQMQIQMEVCDCPACEYVEVKFKELEANDPQAQSWITLERNIETQVCRYQYHTTPTPLTPQEGWEQVETYGWQMVHMRRVTQHRDPLWFQGIQNDLQKFWEDVQGARSGTWIPPPAKAKKAKDKKCLIMDD